MPEIGPEIQGTPNREKLEPVMSPDTGAGVGGTPQDPDNNVGQNAAQGDPSPSRSEAASPTEIISQLMLTPELNDIAEAELQGAYADARSRIAASFFNSTPGAKERYESDESYRQTVDSNFFNIARNQLESQRQATLQRYAMRAANIGQNPEDAAEEPSSGKLFIPIDSPYGKKLVEWENTKEGEHGFLEHMRTILNDLESTKDAQGGLGTQERLSELAMVISTLRKIKKEEELGPFSPGFDPRKREKIIQGVKDFLNTGIDPEVLYTELVARMTLHSSFLAFERQDNPDQVRDLNAALLNTHLNFFFLDSGKEGLAIQEAFEKYDDPVFVAKYLNSTRGTANDVDNFNEGLVKELEKTETVFGHQSAVSSQRVAERFFQLSGRRAVQNEMVLKGDLRDPESKNPKRQALIDAAIAAGAIDIRPEAVIGGKYVVNLSIPEGRVLADQETPMVEFRGDANGGNLTVQTSVRTKEQVWNDNAKRHAHMQLLDGLEDEDLGGTDYLSTIPAKFQSGQQSILINYFSSNPTHPEYVKASGGKQPVEFAEEVSRELTKWLFSDETLPESKQNKLWRVDHRDGKFKFKPAVGKDMQLNQWKWGSRAQKELPDHLKWLMSGDKPILAEMPVINFDISGTRPLDYWGYLTSGANKSMTEMIKADGFLVHPTAKSLAHTTGIFGARPGGGQYDVKGQMLENFVNFMGSHEGHEMGYISPNALEIQTMIKVIGEELNLTEHQKEEMIDHFLGEGAVKHLAIFWNLTRPNKFFLTFLMELIVNASKQEMKA